MADENTGLVVIDIKPESYPTLYVTNGLNQYLDQIRQAVNEVPDVTTAKGRARIASLAASASRSKTAIEKPGREYLRHLKEQPKIIEAELRRFVIECDEIRDETRRPLTEWEAEQERIKQEAEAKKKAEQLAAEIEVAHEMALLMNDAFDRDAKAKADEVEREKQEAIAAEKLKAQQEAERVQREAKQKEDARLAEEKRVADEAAKKSSQQSSPGRSK
ncbi:hypothetical protein ACSN7A_000839 [Yersinia ruckeri]